MGVGLTSRRSGRRKNDTGGRKEQCSGSARTRQAIENRQSLSTRRNNVPEHEKQK